MVKKLIIGICIGIPLGILVIVYLMYPYEAVLMLLSVFISSISTLTALVLVLRNKLSDDDKYTLARILDKCIK